MLRRMKTWKATPYAALLVLVLALASACSSGGGTTNTTTPPTTGASSGGGNPVTITMSDFKFDPSTVTASTSQDIVLVNSGAALHNFSIEGTSISVDVQPGQTQTLTAPGSSFPTGPHPFFCKYHKAQGMTGTLTATP
jgi:plastocyanin